MSHPTYVEVHPTPNHENDLPAYEAQKHFQAYEERVVATADTYLNSFEETSSHNHDNVEPEYAKEHPLTTNQEILGLRGYSSYEEAIHNEPNYPVEESHDTHIGLQSYSGDHLQPHTTEDPLSSTYEEAFELPSYHSSLGYVEDIQNIPNYLPTEESHDSQSEFPSYSEEHLQENYPIEQADQLTVYNQPHILEPNYAEPSSSTYEEAFELPSQSSSLGYEEDIQNIPNYLHADETHDSHSILPSYSKEHLQEIYPFKQPDQSTVYNQPHNSEPSYAEEDPAILNYEKVIELRSYSSSLGYEEDIQNTPNYSHGEESHDFQSGPSSYSNEHSQENVPAEQPSQHKYPESESAPVQYHGTEYQEIPKLPLYNVAPSVILEHDHKYGHYKQSRETLARDLQEVNNSLHNYSPTPSEDEPGQSHYEVGEPQEYGVSVENYTPQYEQNQDLPSYETRGQDPTEPQHHREPIDYHDINEALPLYNEIESEGQAIQNHHDSYNVEESPNTSNSGMNLYPEYHSEDKGSDRPQEDTIYEEETHLYYDEPAYTVPDVHEEIGEDLYHQFTDPSNGYISPPQVVYQKPPTSYTAPGSYLVPEQIMPATDYVAPGEYPQATSTTTAMTTTVTTTTTTTTTTTVPKTTTTMPTTPAPIETDSRDSFQKITLTLVQSLTTLITNVLTNPPPVAQSPAPPTVIPPQISEPQIVTAVPTLPPSPKTTAPPPTTSPSTPTSKAPELVTTPMPTPLPSQPPFPSVPTPSTLPPKLLLSTPPSPPITTTPVPALPPPTPEMKKMEGVKEITKALDKMPVKMGKMPGQPQKMPLKIEKIPEKMEKMPEKMEKMPEKMKKMPVKMEKMPEKMEAMAKKMEAIPKKMEAIPKKMEAMPKKMEKMPDKMEVMPTTEDKMPEKMKQMPLESETLPKNMDKMPPKDMDPIPMKMMPMTETMDVTTTPGSTLERAVKDLDDLIQQLSTLAG
eukprot:TCALIF_09360-PA protein Name:"Protein of unknown function" AED:0.45 eAED:0.45 QI:0/1/0/1/1/1/2/0/966